MAAVLIPGIFVDAIVQFDFDQELQTNQQLRNAPPQQQASFRASYAPLIGRRLRDLRLRVAVGFSFIASACITALLVGQHPEVGFRLPAHSTLAILSLFVFAWATLGQLGWREQTHKGRTSIDRLNQSFFWVLYWLGTFWATLGLS
jgi:hypothetical protein